MIRANAEYAAMLANLTSVQERCNELLEEARTARRERDASRATSLALAKELQRTQDALNALVEALAEVPEAIEGPAN